MSGGGTLVILMNWQEIDGWFQWRSGQEEALRHFPADSRFVEVGTYLGRSLCSLGELVVASGRPYHVIGVDTCVGSGPEGPHGRDYHAAAVAREGGTLAGALHRSVIACGLDQVVALIIADSVSASRFFADGSIDWVHLDARHDFDGLTADILAWRPKIRAGGWLSGDDYDEVKWPDVVRAVTEVLPDARPWSTQQWRLVVP